MRTKQKLTFIFLLISLVPTTILGLYTSNLAKVYVGGQTSHEIEVDVAMLSKDIQSFFVGIEKDVLFLSKSDSLVNIFDAQGSGNEAELTQSKLRLGKLFRGFSDAIGIYDQIRFIDESGQEIIRVDMEGPSPRILNDDELQNKADRYYFTETMRLGPSEVYASPLDLNVEHGEVEVPYKPMIRFSTPVFDGAGNRRGIVIINVYAETVLLKVKEASILGLTYLVDQNGFYMEHPDDGKEWGRDLGTDENLVNDYPQEATSILTGKAGIIQNQQDHIVSTLISYNQYSPDARFILINIVPMSEVLVPYQRTINALFMTLLLAFFAAVTTGLILARMFIDPLARLTEGAKTMTTGDLDIQIPVTSNDELGELAAAFNTMAKALKSSHNTLEVKVERRTRKLDEANRELQGYLEVIEEQNKKLMELDELKSEFIVTATHELRTPVTSILGFVDIMMDDEGNNLSDVGKKDLEIVLRNANRLATLTNDLLDVQRIQSGRLEITPKEFDLAGLIQQVSEELAPLFQERKQRLSMDVPGSGLVMLGDEIRISQVLTNLLRNANKFTPDEGEISLSTKKQGDRIEVRIKDTGIGMAPEDMDKLFKPFPGIHHGLNVTSSGLGLSISKGIVELHKGTIWAESEGKGKGSTFTFSIPVQK